jgi:hypothetical protein
VVEISFPINGSKSEKMLHAIQKVKERVGDKMRDIFDLSNERIEWLNDRLKQNDN